MMMPSSVEVRNDDEAIFSHMDVLFRYAITRVADRQAAEDLVQDTMVAAVQSLARFAAESSMRTWLIGILKHKIVDHYRMERRRQGHLPLHAGTAPERDEGLQEPWFTPSGAWRWDPNDGLEMLDGDPHQGLERKQLREALSACIAHLPESVRTVFVLRELEGLPVSDVGPAVGIATQSVTVFLYRARQLLRVCMQKKWMRA